MKRLKVRRSKTKKSGKRLLLICAVMLCLATIMFFYADSCIRPTVTTMASMQAQAMSTIVINQAVTDYLDGQHIDYGNLVVLERDNNGNIISVQTDMSKLNILKAEITTKAQEALFDYTKDSVGIPIGNLTGMDFFTGKGPKVKITYDITCSATSNISSSFESAGINQVLHKITLDISTQVYSMVPGNQTTSTTTSSFCIAETVIVGLSPNSYANLDSEYMNGPSIVE